MGENQKEMQKLKRLLQEKDDLIDDLKKCLSAKEAEISKLQRKMIVRNSNEVVDAQKLNSFLPMLSVNQLALMTKEKKRVNWTSEEISEGFTLSYFHAGAYNYLRKKRNYPMPSIRTLNQRAEKFIVEPGILKDFVFILKSFAETLTEGERQVILSFDEMKCKSLYEYNKTLDIVMGPHQQMQTIMARGLFKQFKQPIYVNFDEKITLQRLNLLATELHKINLNVVGFVGDNGGGNVGLWSQVGINFEGDIRSTIPHPVTGKNIFIFSDIPHLLKLLRNWFLDGGFILGNGTIINDQKIYDLLTTNTEISPNFKLSLLHLKVKGVERQNVALAAELLSHSVAESLKKAFPNDTDAQKLSKFIELVNNWFDIMNSYSMNGVGYKKPFGIGLEQQTKVLDEMFETIKTMKCINKKKEIQNALQIFQKGILISIVSLKALHLTMKENFEYSYILTHRLNQDCLENFYSQMRYRNGANDHPTPVECLNNIKKIMLGKNPGMFTDSNYNTVDREPVEYASAMFNKKTSVNDYTNKNQESDDETAKEDAGIEFDNQITEEFIEDLSNEIETNEKTKRTLQSTEEGLEYISGWIAWKLKATHPRFSKTRRANVPSHTSDHSYSKGNGITSTSWIDSISYGGLTKPIDDVLKWVHKLEYQFNEIHGNTFNRQQNIQQKLVNSLKEKCSEVPLEIIRLFAKSRIYMRCKYLNKKAAEEAILRRIEAQNTKVIKRNATENIDDLSRSKNKKMKKIIN